MRTFILLFLLALMVWGCGARVSGRSGPNSGGQAEVNVFKW